MNRDVYGSPKKPPGRRRFRPHQSDVGHAVAFRRNVAGQTGRGFGLPLRPRSCPTRLAAVLLELMPSGDPRFRWSCFRLSGVGLGLRQLCFELLRSFAIPVGFGWLPGEGLPPVESPGRTPKARRATAWFRDLPRMRAAVGSGGQSPGELSPTDERDAVTRRERKTNRSHTRRSAATSDRVANAVGDLGHPARGRKQHRPGTSGAVVTSRKAGRITSVRRRRCACRRSRWC